MFSQNLALNVAEKGFRISVYNRTYAKTEACEKRAKKEGALCPCAATQLIARSRCAAQLISFANLRTGLEDSDYSSRLLDLL